jgi:hypothetical protein
MYLTLLATGIRCIPHNATLVRREYHDLYLLHALPHFRFCFAGTFIRNGTRDCFWKWLVAYVLKHYCTICRLTRMPGNQHQAYIDGRAARDPSEFWVRNAHLSSLFLMWTHQSNCRRRSMKERSAFLISTSSHLPRN